MARLNEQDDSPTRFEYLAEGNAKQARKRVAVDLIIQDEAGKILLVDPDYKDFWDLPGGMSEANESLTDTAIRELNEELGLDIGVGRLLVVSWVEAHGPWDDQLVFVFDGGTLDADTVGNMRIKDSELRDYTFLSPDEAAERLRPDMAALLRSAVRNLRDGTAEYLETSGPTICPG